MSDLALTGLYLLAGGTLLGWPVALTHIDPDLVARVGIRHPRRLLQLHLDYVLMGILVLAVGTALPGLPTWLAVSLGIGATVNPLLFLPLAFRQSVSQALWYRALSVLSFLAMSIGAVGAAWWATAHA